MSEPLYGQFDVIRERGFGRGARRWEIITVEPERYLVQPLFTALYEPRYGWWERSAAEALTELEYRGHEPGVVCHCGAAYLPPATCRQGHKPTAA